MSLQPTGKSFLQQIKDARFAEKAGKAYILVDDKMPRLKCRITKGKKTFAVRHGQKWVMLGNFPEMSVTDARAAAIKKLEQFQFGEYHETQRSSKSRKPLLTFCELAEEITKHYTAETLKVRFKYSRKALERFWFMPIGQITPDVVKRWMREYGKATKPATVCLHFDYLNGCMNKAVEMGLLNDNPIKGVKKPKVDNARTRHLGEFGDDEFARFIQALEKRDKTDPLRLFCVVALYSGMRKGEILGLEWSEINFHRQEITLKPTRHKAVHQTGKSKTVVLHPKALRVLEDAFKSRESDQFVFYNKSTGTHQKDIKRSFNSLCVEAGIIEFTPHCLRHTFASQMIMAGGTLEEIAAIVGHKDLRMTQRYAHFSQEHLRSKLGRLK